MRHSAGRAPEFQPGARERHAEHPQVLQRLEAMPAQCLRSLRRLGLLADAERYRVPAVEWVLHGEPLAQLQVGLAHRLAGS